LVVGEAIRQNLPHDAPTHLTDASVMASRITLLTSCLTLVAGFMRLGFVDVIGSPVSSLVPSANLASDERVY
jgi:hypothetical protein